jgi:hypothetical protein
MILTPLERLLAANGKRFDVTAFARGTRSNSDEIGVGAAPGRERETV